MGTESKPDIIGYLERQHEQLRLLFERVRAARGSERADAFAALRRLMVIHETAEEEIVHPIARRVLAGGAEIVAARLQEERSGKKLLARLESMSVDSREFEPLLDELGRSVIAHAAAEEAEELARLRRELEPARLVRLRRAAEIAEAMAPTHPHPSIEGPASTVLAGPFAALVDRARDALARKS